MRALIILVVVLLSFSLYGQVQYTDIKDQRVKPTNFEVLVKSKEVVSTFYNIGQSFVQGTNSLFIGEVDVFYLFPGNPAGVLNYRNGYIREVAQDSLLMYVVDWENSVIVNTQYALSDLLEYRKNFIDNYTGTINADIWADLVGFYDVTGNFDSFSIPTTKIGNVLHSMIGDDDIRINVFLFCFMDNDGDVFYYIHDPANGFVVWRGI